MKKRDFELLPGSSALNGRFPKVLPLLDRVLWSDKSCVERKMPSGLCASGWCLIAATASHRDVMRNLAGGVGGSAAVKGGKALKVPLPWRRSCAKQDFHQWTNKRCGGCLTGSLMRAQQPPPNC